MSEQQPMMSREDYEKYLELARYYVRRKADSGSAYLAQALLQADSERDAAVARAEAMREALKPFAALGRMLAQCENMPPMTQPFEIYANGKLMSGIMIIEKDFRRAARALDSDTAKGEA